MVEGRYGANTVYTLGKWKNNTCWNYCRNRGREDKWKRWRGWIQMIYCKSFCKWYNVTLFSTHINKSIWDWRIQSGSTLLCPIDP
jgi:hypothetical protein